MGMSEQVNPVPAEENESSSGLLLSVEPLEKSTKLYATDTVDGGADSDVTGADTDATDKSDTDGTDGGDSDGTDESDADGTDNGDSDGSDTVDADGTDAS
jgi:hypothetical protein